MSKQLLSVLTVTLLVTCVGEGVDIYHLRKSTIADPWRPVDSWISEVNKEMRAGQSLSVAEFDKLFNDEFFSHRFDPFKEIENFSQKVRSMVQGDEQAWLNDSWAHWFEYRMDVTELHPQITSTPHEVTLALHIPHLKGDSLKVDVNKDRVRLSYKAETRQVKKDKQGHVIQTSSSLEDMEKIMPIPDGANAGAFRVIRKPEAVEIVFDRTSRGRARDRHAPEERR